MFSNSFPYFRDEQIHPYLDRISGAEKVIVPLLRFATPTALNPVHFSGLLPPNAHCSYTSAYAVLFCVHSMQSSVLLCISTLLDGGNHYCTFASRSQKCRSPVSTPAHPCTRKIDILRSTLS